MADTSDKSLLSFEDALSGLEDAVSALKDKSATLEEALKNYEEGMAYYAHCEEMLNKVQQRIVFLGKDGTPQEVGKDANYDENF
ncbi:MAG: exodeoxyribonuclease VII small subunit [Clostridiales Family XIII bacterium]|jgi:exodeoxyribonuclease VII small subunit|nr:exodeoxyribonuclease VII small subunit [Clostridiales Family XIII bacterium]